MGFLSKLFGTSATPVKMPNGYMDPKKMAKEQRKLNESTLNSNLQYLQQYGAAERQLTEDQRNSDLQFLNNKGADLAGIFGRLAPSYAAMGRQSAAIEADLNGPNPMAAENTFVRQQLYARNPLYDMLQGQAQSELGLGGQLSPEEERAAAQSARSGAAARGMATGSGSLFSEALNRDRLATARQNDRRNFANNVIGTGLQLDAQNNQRLNWLLSSTNQDEQNRLANRSLLLNYSNAQLSPLLGTTYGNRSGVNLNSAAAATSSAPQLNQLTQMWSDQYNAKAAAANSAANNRAALWGSVISAGSKAYKAGGPAPSGAE